MPIFRLGPDPIFPPPHLAEPEGLLAVGGDLSLSRLLMAYSQGIFPWYNAGDPPLWWSPDPRCIILPETLHLSRSLRKTLRRGAYQITIDRDFSAVISACAHARNETWIVPELADAYTELHRLGFAHSVECWHEGALVGGLYGVALGRCFCGESMFHRRRDASKIAFATAAMTLFAAGYAMIDAQLSTPHLQRLGAITLPRSDYLQRLRSCGVEPGAEQTAGKFPERVWRDW